jgi:hypothetical protein
MGSPSTPPATRRNYWNQAWRRFDALRPRLAEFAELAGADSYAARRVFDHAASKLLRLAVAFEEVARSKEALFVCYTARTLAPDGSLELPAIDAKLRALGVFKEPRERSPAEYAEGVRHALVDVRASAKLFRDDPKGGKTLDSFTQKGDDTPGCLTSAAFWLAIVATVFGLQWCGVINTRRTRTSINSFPTMNISPNMNFGVPNINYNIPPPLDLRQYIEPLPRSTRRPGGRRTRPPRDTNVAPPPTSVERAPNRNAPPRE